jgi:hypothetical protein
MGINSNGNLMRSSVSIEVELLVKKYHPALPKYSRIGNLSYQDGLYNRNPDRKTSTKAVNVSNPMERLISTGEVVNPNAIIKKEIRTAPSVEKTDDRKEAIFL